MRDPKREDIFVALQALLASRLLATAYPTMVLSRRMVMPTELGDIQQPALFLREWDEVIASPHRGLPPTRTFLAFLIVYAKNNDPSVPGSSVLNPIIDMIEDICAPDSILTGTITLRVGGQPMIYNLDIEGRIIKETGDTDPNGQCCAIVPLSIISA